MAKESHISATLTTHDGIATTWEVGSPSTPARRDRLTIVLDTAGALVILGGVLAGVATVAAMLEIGTWTDVTTWAAGAAGALLALGAALCGIGTWRYRRLRRG